VPPAIGVYAPLDPRLVRQQRHVHRLTGGTARLGVVHADLRVNRRLELSAPDPVRHQPGARTGRQRRRGGEVGSSRLGIARVEPDPDLAAERPRGGKPAGQFQEVTEALARLLEPALPVQRDREAPQRLGRRRVSVGRRLGGQARVLETPEPPERLRGQHERRDPHRGNRVIQVAMGHPQGRERMIRAAARVFPQRLQGILRGFPAATAVLGGNKVEPPGRGAPQRLAWFEVGGLAVRDVPGAGVMGGPRPWNDGWCHIISGHRAHGRFLASGRAR
jgi:hypothetical protein